MSALPPNVLELHVRLTCDGGKPSAAWLEDFHRYEAMARYLAHQPDPAEPKRMLGRDSFDRAVACHFDPSLRHLPLTFWKEDE